MVNSALCRETIQHNCVIAVDPNSEDYQDLAIQVNQINLQFGQYQTGEDALRSVHASCCKLWLVNLDLPDMTGIEFLSAVREKYSVASVFLIGNNQDPIDEIQARMAGPTAYLCKPVHSSWLSGLTNSSVAAAGCNSLGNKTLTVMSAHF